MSAPPLFGTNGLAASKAHREALRHAVDGDGAARRYPTPEKVPPTPRVDGSVDFMTSVQSRLTEVNSDRLG
jgi:hypothetical protein